MGKILVSLSCVIIGLCLFPSVAFVLQRNFLNNNNSCKSVESKTRIQAEWKKKLEETGDKLEKAGSGGVAETATGAVLGGLILGPFGALFGAQIGASIGAKNSIEKERMQKMKELGITPEMLEMAQEVGVTLNRAVEGLNACRDSLQTQQRLAKRLDSDIERIYEDAKAAMIAKEEDRARQLLFERDRLQKKLKKVLMSCVDEKKRVQQMKNNVEAIEDRAMEIESLLNRSVGAKALDDTSSTNFEMGLKISEEDPLLQKFRDLENK